jgi:hypothetical protein
MYNGYCFVARLEYKRHIEYMLKERPMKTHASISDTVAAPFLLPGTLACRAMGVTRNTELVRMLFNSLFWTVFGVAVVWAVAA